MKFKFLFWMVRTIVVRDYRGEPGIRVTMHGLCKRCGVLITLDDPQRFFQATGSHVCSGLSAVSFFEVKDEA